MRTLDRGVGKIFQGGGRIFFYYNIRNSNSKINSSAQTILLNNRDKLLFISRSEPNISNLGLFHARLILYLNYVTISKVRGLNFMMGALFTRSGLKKLT